VTAAAIDIGTNSTRLLVLDAAGRAVHRRTEITQIGRAIEGTGQLDPDGVARTLDVLRDYRAVLDRLGVTRVTVAGTAAVRRASDAAAFLVAVEEAAGAEPIVLSGAEEGRLTFVGATADLDPANGAVLVVDLGGGSTELAVGQPGAADGPSEIVSIDLGCVTITEAELASDPPRPEELTNAIGAASHADARRALPLLEHVRTVVGVGGTITTVAAVELGLARYDRDRVHGLVLPRTAVEDVFRTLATEALADRVHNPGLQRERADVIVGGCCILVALLRNLPADELRVSDADLLDALARALL
jgi:exopolyphosphatase / guanosine-5'-triphosphate,3'-diphosphate pyrophosphatase